MSLRVKKAGYGAAPFEEKPTDSADGRLRRFVVSLVFLLPLFYLSMGHMLGAPLPGFIHQSPFVMALLQLVLTLPIVIVNRVYFIKGFKNLVSGATMDTLIAIGARCGYGVQHLCNLSNRSWQGRPAARSIL